MNALIVIFALFVISCNVYAAPKASLPSALPVQYAIAPYATSYNAHTINHAIAAPVAAAPLIAAPPPFAAAAPAPFLPPPAAPFYSAAPAFAPYAALPAAAAAPAPFFYG